MAQSSSTDPLRKYEQQRTSKASSFAHAMEPFVIVAFVALIVAILFAKTTLPTALFNAVLRLGSTPKDTTVGDVPPIDGTSMQDILNGKHALVVGGTRGIGRGIALALARGGAVGSVTVVGRDTHAILGQLEAVAATASNQTFRAYSTDLSTVVGAQQLVEGALLREQEPFDYVFFTVGCWPNYNVPFTSDGIEQVVALDLLSHHVVLKGLMKYGLLRPGSRVMNTIASTQNFPFQSRQSVQGRLTESTNTMKGPGILPFTLFPVAIAADAWLREASKRYPDLLFVGQFPGIVVTDLPQSSFPRWTMPFLRAGMSPIAISEEESGLAHVTVMTSQNVGRHKVSFFNHLLEGREAHPVALDDELSSWVFDWLESTSKLHSKSNV